MPQKPTFQLPLSSAMAPLRRFAVRYVQPFLVRPFEGRPLAGGLKQIARTLRAMGVQPEDSIVQQIGSEFRLLFCAATPVAKMKSQSSGSLIDPVKSISDLLRKPPPQTGTSAAAAALSRFVALCKRAILSRLRRSFL